MSEKKVQNSSLESINLVASAMFGVYLIHDNPDMHGLLWKKVFNIASFQDYVYFPLLTVLISLAIFVSCAIIDFIRKNTLERIIRTPICYIDERMRSIFERTKK